MKRLFVLRHAEAVPKDTEEDVDRVLSARGRGQMERVARHLRDAGIRPDEALVSPAARTRETWELTRLGDVPARFDRRIYEATPDDLLAVLRDAEADANSAILVGHNPGLHELVRQLVGSDRPASLRQLADFPTACLASLDLGAESWRDVSWRGATLTALVTPGSLGA